MQSNDGDDYEDKKPSASRKHDAPMEDTLNKDIVESDNDPPRKLGCVEVTEDDQLSKAKALEALAEGMQFMEFLF